MGSKRLLAVLFAAAVLAGVVAFHYLPSNSTSIENLVTPSLQPAAAPLEDLRDSAPTDLESLHKFIMLPATATQEDAYQLGKGRADWLLTHTNSELDFTKTVSELSVIADEFLTRWPTQPHSVEVMRWALISREQLPAQQDLDVRLWRYAQACAGLKPGVTAESIALDEIKRINKLKANPVAIEYGKALIEHAPTSPEGYEAQIEMGAAWAYATSQPEKAFTAFKTATLSPDPKVALRAKRAYLTLSKIHADQARIIEAASMLIRERTLPAEEQQRITFERARAHLLRNEKSQAKDDYESIDLTKVPVTLKRDVEELGKQLQAK